MFDLPDLEIYAELFERKFKNRALLRLEIQQKKCIDVSIEELSKSLIGNQLKKVWREGLSLPYVFNLEIMLS